MREYRQNSFRDRARAANQQMEKSESTPFSFQDSNGLSLISTLWILTVLSVLAMQMLYSYDLESKSQGNFSDRVKYHYAAKAGFEWGVAKLRIDETNFDALGESWAEQVQHQIDDGVQTGNMINYQVSITDEETRVDLNNAEEDLIRNLLTHLGAQPENNETGDLATRIVEGRPYRTVRDVARVEGMTQEILYGLQQQQAPIDPETNEPTNIPPQIQATGSGGLVNTATVYSVDSHTDSNGQQRVNINTAQAQQIRQIQSRNNQSVFSQGEANAIIQKRQFNRISALLDVQAVSDDVFNNIRESITVEASSGGRINNQQGRNNNNNNQQGRNNNNNNNQQGRNNSNQQGPDENDGGGDENNEDEEEEVEEDPLTNINTADASELQELQGIDNGIANRIIAHRNSEGNFQNIDEIKNVKVLTVNELAGIVDKITIKDGQTVNGLININTAPLEIIQLLPGMDQQKAQAIINRREEENPDLQGTLGEPVKGNPFTDIGQLLDIEEIDQQSFREVVDWVTYRSKGFRITSSAIDMSGKTIAICYGIVVRNENQLSISYWRQD